MSGGTAIIDRLERAVFDGRIDEVLGALDDAGADGPSAERLAAALAAGMERIRVQVAAGALATAEILVAAEAFREGVRELRARGGAIAKPDRAGIVIGVVPGDVHDLGKNIVAVVLESLGHPVVDVGLDARADAFVAAIEQASPRPAVVALSTMMSTTLENLRELIRDLRRFDAGLALLAGGAALDERVARALGADGYADSAATAPDEVARLLAVRQRG